jgi:hypothetical protein
MPKELSIVLIGKRSELRRHRPAFRGQRQRLIAPILVAFGPRLVIYHSEISVRLSGMTAGKGLIRVAAGVIYWRAGSNPSRWPIRRSMRRLGRVRKIQSRIGLGVMG